MLLMVDNYDSFTYNIVQYLRELGADVEVVLNDQLDLAAIEKLAPQRIVISPGPCSPDEAGISVPLIRAFGGRVPILGICLGHQCIGAAFGGKVVRANRVMHGKTSLIEHAGKGLFQGLPNPLRATRYHSLVVDHESLPQELEITAKSADPGDDRRYIMGLQHKHLPIHGVQFHPESILSECGHALLQNFLNLPEASWK
ncbi:aminodeoxychorismate/anthranilate synthase component II [Saccharophagus sp. K07]|jgi:anthranilate synthase component 2|uniref:anthranilate synthase component II n=1 Tax=Saccharophagus sp. K07 TaxID=2283636 RepID=UPI001651B294|nr:aminodeoxychorismate/anthranilate synthase component II [Saccharophagus sp. K07]MBC6903976.1 aminodeoxychorismate/anthranilate synthase component II [Saccharophagus sp. K07]